MQNEISRVVEERIKNDLSREEKDAYVEVLKMMDIYAHHKLDASCLFDLYDLLSDVLLERMPSFALGIKREDRISVQVRMMKKSKLAYKLDLDEMENIALVVYWTIFIRVIDEKRELEVSGLMDFSRDCYEKMNKYLNEFRDDNPELFNYREEKMIDFKTYGLDLDNPIQVMSMDDELEYLYRLRYEGYPIKYQRLGSNINQSDHIIDIYLIHSSHLELQFETYLYIDVYATSNIFIAPNGFTINA